MSIFNPIISAKWESELSPNQVTEFEDDIKDRILSITYTEKTKGADEASLVLNNHDLALFDDDRIARGNKLHLAWGYMHEMSPVRVFTIKEVKGWSKLNISGSMSDEEDFIGQQKTRIFENKCYYEIATQIAREYGFVDPSTRDIEVPDTIIRRDVVQDSKSDYQFLTELAEEDGWIFRISLGIFHFHPVRDGEQPNLTLVYFTHNAGWFVGEPQIEEGDIGVPSRVTRRGRSTRERSDVSGTAGNNDDPQRNVQGERVLLIDPDTGNTRTVIRSRENRQSSDQPTTAQTNEEATNESRARFRAAERKALKLSVQLIGMPQLKADTNIRLEGIGQRLSGNYLIKEIQHNIGQGYKCRLKLVRNAVSGGRRSGQATARATLNNIRRLQLELVTTRNNNQITEEQYQERLRDISRLEARAWSSAIERANGQQNNRNNRASNNTQTTQGQEMQRVVSIDPDTGNRRTLYRRPSSTTG